MLCSLTKKGSLSESLSLFTVRLSSILSAARAEMLAIDARKKSTVAEMMHFAPLDMVQVSWKWVSLMEDEASLNSFTMILLLQALLFKKRRLKPWKRVVSINPGPMIDLAWSGRKPTAPMLITRKTVPNIRARTVNAWDAFQLASASI